MKTFSAAEMQRMALLDERLQRGEALSRNEERFYSAHEQERPRWKQQDERFVEVALNERQLLPSLTDEERQLYLQWMAGLRYNVQRTVDLLRAVKGRTAMWEISVAFWLRLAPEQGEGRFIYVVQDGKEVPATDALMLDGEPIQVCKAEEYHSLYLLAWKGIRQLRRAVHPNCSCLCPMLPKMGGEEYSELGISIAEHSDCAAVLTSALFGGEGPDETFRQGVFTKINRVLASGKIIEHAGAYFGTTLDTIRRDMNRSRAADNGGHSRIGQKLDAVGITVEPLRTVMGTLMYLGGVEIGVTYQRLEDEVRSALTNWHCNEYGLIGSEIYISSEEISVWVQRAFAEPRIGEEVKHQLMSRFIGARNVVTDRTLPDDDESQFEADLVCNTLVDTSIYESSAEFDNWNDAGEDEDNVEDEDHPIAHYRLKERCLKLALEQPNWSTRQVVKIVISKLLAENGVSPEAIVEVLEDDAIHGHIAVVAKEVNSDLRALRGVHAEVSWSVAD